MPTGDLEFKNPMILENMEASYNILSSNYNQDNTLNIRVHSLEKPAEGVFETAPQLDDVYFIALKTDESVLEV